MNLKSTIVFFISLLLICTSCGTQRHTTSSVSSWQTVKVSNATLTIQTDENQMNITCNLYAVRDSIIILSVVPMFGLEIVRIAFSPSQVTIVDKINKRYMQTNWKELSQIAGQRLKWKMLWENEKFFQLPKHHITITWKDGTSTWDAPNTIKPIHLDSYQPFSLLDFISQLQR